MYREDALFTVDDTRRSRAPEIPVLLTRRLRLRAWGKVDVRALAWLYDDSRVTQFFPRSCISPITMGILWASWLRNGFGSWAVAERKTGRFLGSISLALPGHRPTPEISWILDPRFWGQGLATEGAKAVVDHAFAMFAFDQLISVCLAGNTRSERVMQKLGMQRTPSFGDVSIDPLLCTYLLTKEQWQIQSRRGSSPLR